MIKQLDQIINKEIAKHVSIVARSDSDRESVKTDKNTNVHKKGFNLFVAKKPNKPKTYRIKKLVNDNFIFVFYIYFFL
jgi:hypothetical protein